MNIHINFTSIFLAFMFVMTTQRIWETFFKKLTKEKGCIQHRWTLFALTLVHASICILTVVEYLLIKRQLNVFMSALGLFLFLLSLFLRKWSIKALGKYHSVHIEIRDHHRLIKEGPYKYMRHPYYLSVMLELVGFPLIPNAYFSFLISLCFYFPLVFIRLYLEEIEMINKFGDSYDIYKNEIMGLLPIKKRKNKIEAK